MSERAKDAAADAADAGDAASSPELACAAVNDALRLSDLHYDLAEELAEDERLGEAAGRVQAELQDISGGFVSFAKEAAAHAAVVVVRDLQGVFDAMFDLKWEDGDSTQLRTLTSTLEDYEADLDAWLPSRSYETLLRALLDKTLGGYIAALLSKSDPFATGTAAARTLRKDRDVLAAFFLKRGERLASTGLGDEAKVAAQFAVLSAIADAAGSDPAHPPDEACARQFLLEFAGVEAGAEAFARALGLGGAYGPSGLEGARQVLRGLAGGGGEADGGAVVEGRFRLEEKKAKRGVRAIGRRGSAGGASERAGNPFGL